jgi:TonB-dependent starch-binding outer membrane protein SusC
MSKSLSIFSIATMALYFFSQAPLFSQDTSSVVKPLYATESDCPGITIIQGEFNKGLTLSPWQTLQGRIPGMTIISNNGEPGSDYTLTNQRNLNFLGMSKPLVIVDDMPVYDIPLSLNPNDIAEIRYLEDGLAAGIYGGEAANGVLIISTRKGSSVPKVHYSSSLSMSTVQKRFDLLSADEYRSLVTDKWGSTEDISEVVGYANTDWQDVTFQNGFGQDHYLSISGPIFKVPVSFSFGKTIQEGVIKTSIFDRTTASFSASSGFFNNHLNLSADIIGIFGDNHVAANEVTRNMFFCNPSYPVYDDKSSDGYYYQGWYQNNTLAMLSQTHDKMSTNTWLGSFSLNYLFYYLKGLEFRLDYGFNNYEENYVNKTDTIARWTSYKGYWSRSENNIKNRSVDYCLTYSKEFYTIPGRIELKAGIKHLVSHDNFNNSSGAYYAGNIGFSEGKAKENHDGIYGRMFYSFRDKYSITFNISNNDYSRYDFSDKKSNTVFPSCLISWNLKNESFLERNNTISALGIFAGYGVSGNFQAPDFSSNTYFYANHLKQERISSLNLGTSFGFFNNNLSGTIMYYDTEGKDMLMPLHYYGSDGWLVSNAGSVNNRGIEIRLSSKVKMNKDWSWDVACNFSFNKNRIDSVGHSFVSFEKYNFLYRYNGEGHPVNSFYFYQQAYDANNYPIAGTFVDRKVDGEINSEDQYFVGTADPKIIIGISSDLRYKNWDFSFSGRLHYGNSVLNTENFYSNYGELWGSNVSASIIKSRMAEPDYFSDYFVEKASFFRMDYMSLGYSFKISTLSKVQFNASATVMNAFVITKYSGQDPEVVNGVPDFDYPRPRTFSLKISADF